VLHYNGCLETAPNGSKGRALLGVSLLPIFTQEVPNVNKDSSDSWSPVSEADYFWPGGGTALCAPMPGSAPASLLVQFYAQLCYYSDLLTFNSNL